MDYNINLVLLFHDSNYLWFFTYPSFMSIVCFWVCIQMIHNRSLQNCEMTPSLVWFYNRRVITCFMHMHHETPDWWSRSFLFYYDKKVAYSILRAAQIHILFLPSLKTAWKCEMRRLYFGPNGGDKAKNLGAFRNYVRFARFESTKAWDGKSIEVEKRDWWAEWARMWEQGHVVLIEPGIH